MDDERAFETGCEISNVVRPEPMDVVPESVTRRRWSVGAKERIVAEESGAGRERGGGCAAVRDIAAAAICMAPRDVRAGEDDVRACGD